MGRPPMQQPIHAYQFQSMHHSVASPVPSVPRKRSWEQDNQISRIREIRPRVPGSTESPILPVTNGESIQISRLTPSDNRGEPLKKRGRPNKEERERRDQEYAAKGEVYKPKPRKPKKSEFVAGSPLPPSVADAEPTPGLSPGLEDSSPETPPRSILDHKPESSRSTSKKKRPRESLDAMDVATARLSTSVPSEELDTLPAGAESPSDRLLARSKERAHIPKCSTNICPCHEHVSLSNGSPDDTPKTLEQRTRRPTVTCKLELR